MSALEAALFGEEDPLVAVAEFCETHLDSGLDHTLFRSIGTGLVVGAELLDGRRIVVKVHRWRADRRRLQAVVSAQNALAARGVPIPRAVAGPAALGAGVATVEEFLPAVTADARDPRVRSALATALFQLISAGRTIDEPALGNAALTRAADAPLWPEPHDIRMDFAASERGAEWIDELAEAAVARYRRSQLRSVLGHLDWRVENLGFRSGQVSAIYDSDSLGYAPEPFIVGNAMGQFTTNWTLGYPVPQLTEMLAFVTDYETARGRPFDDDEFATLDAANLYHLAYSARCEHSNRVLGGGGPTAFADLLTRRGPSLLAR